MEECWTYIWTNNIYDNYSHYVELVFDNHLFYSPDNIKYTPFHLSNNCDGASKILWL